MRNFAGLEFGAHGRGVGAEHRHLQPFADARAVPFDRKRRNPESLAVGIGVVDEAARTQHMRILEQILGTIDRREADVEPVERCRKLSHVPALDHLGDARNDPARARMRSVVVRSAGSSRNSCQAELAAEALPMAFGDDADENALAARGLENIVDRPGMFALRHRARLVAGHLILDHVLRDEEQAILEQADADVGTAWLPPRFW